MNLQRPWAPEECCSALERYCGPQHGDPSSGRVSFDRRFESGLSIEFDVYFDGSHGDIELTMRFHAGALSPWARLQLTNIFYIGEGYHEGSLVISSNPREDRCLGVFVDRDGNVELNPAATED